MTQAQQVESMLNSGELKLGNLTLSLKLRGTVFTRAFTDDMPFYYFEDGSKLGTHYRKGQWWAQEPQP